jgi:hypothetical protein
VRGRENQRCAQWRQRWRCWPIIVVTTDEYDRAVVNTKIGANRTTRPISSPQTVGQAMRQYAFRFAEQRRRPDCDYFAAQYPAYMCPCQRFDAALADGHA